MHLSPDSVVLWSWGPIHINATIAFTWLVMALLVGGSWLVTRDLTSWIPFSRGQNMLEMVVLAIRDQIRDVGQQEPDPYVPFVGTLFLLIVVSNLLGVVPGYQAPTGSLSTTAALALAVFVAVPVFGIAQQGIGGFLRHYLEPTPIMLPLNIISEFSRTLALAVRLFGNVMSGAMIVGILLTIVPFFVPVVMQVLGLLTGFIQAYIFAILAMVYIAAATRNEEQEEDEEEV